MKLRVEKTRNRKRKEYMKEYDVERRVRSMVGKRMQRKL